jgi:hypothetical protein
MYLPYSAVRALPRSVVLHPMLQAIQTSEYRPPEITADLELQ